MIEDYRPEHRHWFELLNREWIERYFRMEPVDVDVLTKPETTILGRGGYILMASYPPEIVGTVALKRVSDDVFEFTKMAVLEGYRGKGIGRSLSEAALEKAKDVGAKKVILYSSTKLANAIALYRKLGFREVPVDGPYERSDIKMEIYINDFFGT